MPDNLPPAKYEFKSDSDGQNAYYFTTAKAGDVQRPVCAIGVSV